MFYIPSGYRQAVQITAAATAIPHGPPDALLFTATFTGAITVGGTAITLTSVAANTILELSPEIVQTISAGTLYGLYRAR